MDRELTIEALKNEYIKFFDHEKLYSNLALCGLYLATFEILKSSIIHNIRGFFLELEVIDIQKEQPARYKEVMGDYFKIYAGKKDKEYLACCHWLKDMNAVTQEECDQLIAIKDERNIIAHELPYVLLDPQKNVNTSLLTKSKELIRKIDVWWIINVDVPINADLHESPPQEDEVIPSRSLVLDHVFQSFLKYFPNSSST